MRHRCLCLPLALLLTSLVAADSRPVCHEAFEFWDSTIILREGVFTSENYPHALPVQSNCTYDFKVVRSLAWSRWALCIRFDELDLFTLNRVAETTIELRVEDQANPVIEYSGNGSLIRERMLRAADSAVFKRPRHLLDSPLCLRLPDYKNTYAFTLSVKNDLFVMPHIDKPRRFLAKYYIADTNLDNVTETNSSSGRDRMEQHRCLGGTYINKSKRCDGKLDCGHDFFPRESSDESYEHARCSRQLSFGTNFAKDRVSGHRPQSSFVQLDCSSRGDHSRFYGSAPDARDCGLAMMRARNSSDLELPVLRLSVPQVNIRTGPICHRLYWRSSQFYSPGSLALVSPDGQVLLRLTGRWKASDWEMVEFQTHIKFTGSNYINVFLLRPLQTSLFENETHWIDDLSAEPAPCDASAYETRMPAVCSFEWSSCGWDTNLRFEEDSAISNIYWVPFPFKDHTSELVPRLAVRIPQRVLVLQLGRSGQLVSKRRLPYGESFCFGVWFYGRGDSGYSVRLDVQVDLNVSSETTSYQLTATLPNNEWHLLMAELSPRTPGVPSLFVRVQARQRSELRVVLLDDLSIYSGRCIGYESVWSGNRTVQCGRLESRCADGSGCFTSSQRCDKTARCSDASDKTNCAVDDKNQTVMLALTIPVSLTVIVCLVVLVVAIVSRKSMVQQHQDRGVRSVRSVRSVSNITGHRPLIQTVSTGRLPSNLRSEMPMQFSDRPPSDRSVTDRGAAYAASAGFGEDPPPKYEDAVAAAATATAAAAVLTVDEGSCASSASR